MSLSGGQLAKVVVGRVGKKIAFCDSLFSVNLFPLLTACSDLGYQRT